MSQDKQNKSQQGCDLSLSGSAAALSGLTGDDEGCTQMVVGSSKTPYMPRGKAIVGQASGIIFDCDGCLLDSMDVWRSVEVALMEQTGVEWTQEMLEEMRAAPMPQTAKIFHERHGILENNDAVLEYMHSIMWDYYTKDSEIKPGAAAFIEELADAGVPCAIVSSTPEKYLRAGLEHVGVLDVFATIVSTQEAALSKQDPAIYRLACDRIGSCIDTTWGFDDSIYAIRVMKCAGMHAVGTYDSDDAGGFEALDAAADFAIRSFEELLV